MPKKRKKIVNLSNVKRSRRDGRLMATSFEMWMCDDAACGGLHFDLYGEDYKVFATAMILSGILRSVGAKFCEFAAAFGEKTQ